MVEWIKIVGGIFMGLALLKLALREDAEERRKRSHATESRHSNWKYRGRNWVYFSLFSLCVFLLGCWLSVSLYDIGLQVALGGIIFSLFGLCMGQGIRKPKREKDEIRKSKREKDEGNIWDYDFVSFYQLNDIEQSRLLMNVEETEFNKWLEIKGKE